MSVVLDANVVVALLVADEHQPAARAHLEKRIGAGEELHAPAVLLCEVANVLARPVFEEALKVDDVTEIWRDLAALDLRLHPFDFAQDGPDVAVSTDRLQRRHATGSTYVGLARRRGTTLWTLDGALARNATTLGLPVKLLV